MRYDLEDKVAVVTGGSRGIGFEIARELLEQGARVSICARKPEGLEAARERLAASTGAGDDRLLALQAHVAEPEQVEGLFGVTLERFGKLDILVNNVGMNLMTPAVAEADVGAWRKIIDTNLTGTFLCARRAAQAMRPRKSGKIVNISSIAAKLASPAMGIYGVAKAAVEMLTKTLGVELAADNIQVNALAPCMVKTDFSAPFWSDPEIEKKVTATIPAGRLAVPEDIAPVVLFLCSKSADFITGQTLAVDGGGSAALAGR